MKNVLFIAPTTYQLPLTENLKKKFITLSEVCNVSVLAFANSKTFLNETYGNFYLNKKIKNRLINYFRIIQISIFTTHKIIKKENIDIVCFQDPVSSFFSILFLKVRRAEVKIVVETHGDFIETLSLEKNLVLPRLYKKLFYIMAKYSIGKSNIIRAVSSSTEQQVLDIDSSKSVVRFPAWIDFKDFQNIEPKPLSKDKFNILFIGSVTDRKKPHMIIEAIQRINDKSYNLSIVGPAPNEKYFKELKDLIDKSDLQNQVSLIGPVDRESVKDYYSTSNLMILPSISEGLARVIFESQVAMCPVLVTDAPGMSDIVIDGQTGYVFESNNLDSLSLKIEYIKNNYDEASLVAKNAKGFILSNYSEDNFKFSFKKLFDTV
ncbi:glycosyltransferase [Acidimicrobiaceae bacterium]|nr:glycosyltransferase [Acidimicrobiaceae bacterium]